MTASSSSCWIANAPASTPGRPATTSACRNSFQRSATRGARSSGSAWRLPGIWTRNCRGTIDAVVDGTIKCAQVAAKMKPIGIAFHGWATDMLYRDGKLDRLKEFIDRVHDLGIAAGLSTHNPEILDAMESKGWDNDFYMASLHYLSRRAEDWKRDIGTTPFGELYIASDPPKMCAAVQRVKKPCLVYKVLAAGRQCGSPKDVRAAFEFAFGNIKPIDATIIGLYPRFYPDQIAEDTRIVREITS